MAFRSVQGGAGLSLANFTRNYSELLTEGLMEASNWSVIPKKILRLMMHRTKNSFLRK